MENQFPGCENNTDEITLQLPLNGRVVHSVILETKQTMFLIDFAYSFNCFQRHVDALTILSWEVESFIDGT